MRLNTAVCNLQIVLMRLNTAGCNLQIVLMRLNIVVCNLQKGLMRLNTVGCNLQEGLMRLNTVVCNLRKRLMSLTPAVGHWLDQHGSIGKADSVTYQAEVSPDSKPSQKRDPLGSRRASSTWIMGLLVLGSATTCRAPRFAIGGT